MLLREYENLVSTVVYLLEQLLEHYQLSRLLNQVIAILQLDEVRVAHIQAQPVQRIVKPLLVLEHRTLAQTYVRIELVRFTQRYAVRVVVNLLWLDKLTSTAKAFAELEPVPVNCKAVTLVLQRRSHAPSSNVRRDAAGWVHMQ